MQKQTLNTATVNPDKSAKFVHYSDGSELIPSEVKSQEQSSDNLVTGYTIDDEGIINNHALEPVIYPATYPNSKQQLRYVFWGAGALVLVFTLLLIAFTVS